jgi:hypothetical protein
MNYKLKYIFIVLAFYTQQVVTTNILFHNGTALTISLWPIIPGTATTPMIATLPPYSLSVSLSLPQTGEYVVVDTKSAANYFVNQYASPALQAQALNKLYTENAAQLRLANSQYLSNAAILETTKQWSIFNPILAAQGSTAGPVVKLYPDAIGYAESVKIYPATTGAGPTIPAAPATTYSQRSNLFDYGGATYIYNNSSVPLQLKGNTAQGGVCIWSPLSDRTYDPVYRRGGISWDWICQQFNGTITLPSGSIAMPVSFEQPAVTMPAPDNSKIANFKSPTNYVIETGAGKSGWPSLSVVHKGISTPITKSGYWIFNDIGVFFAGTPGKGLVASKPGYGKINPSLQLASQGLKAN